MEEKRIIRSSNAGRSAAMPRRRKKRTPGRQAKRPQGSAGRQVKSVKTGGVFDSAVDSPRDNRKRSGGTKLRNGSLTPQSERQRPVTSRRATSEEMARMWGR